jgi:hypothetical protein
MVRRGGGWNLSEVFPVGVRSQLRSLGKACAREAAQFPSIAARACAGILFVNKRITEMRKGIQPGSRKFKSRIIELCSRSKPSYHEPGQESIASKITAAITARLF